MVTGRDAFTKLASKTSRVAGRPLTFALALLVIVTWAITGPLFKFSDTWQLVINTGTTIITFLMVFLIQNTQNRESIALHIKIDELIRAVEGAHNSLLDLEELSEEDLNLIRLEYGNLANAAREQLRHGIVDTDCPSVKK